jgi:N4-gp56 family major capsid protein
MAYTEILTSGNSAVTSAEQWESLIFQEYVGKLAMKFLMGTGNDAVIQVKEDLMKKAGDAITFHYASSQTGGTVRGNAMGVGNEGKMDVYAQRVTIDNVRNLHKIWDVPMSTQRSAFDLLMTAKDVLTTKHAEVADDDMVSALTSTSSGRVRGRYLYGAVDSNWSSTHASALTNIDNSADQLTGNMISIAKRKALIEGTGVSEKVRPTRIVNGMNMEEWYIFMGHTYCTRDLVNNDAAYRNQQLLLPPGANSQSPFFTGSHFKGSWDGVLIYEYNRLPLTSSTIQVAHNLLMGAQAGAIAWGQRTKFGEEDEDLKHNVIYELHDIRGEEKLVRSSVDHGLINVFAAAVAD